MNELLIDQGPVTAISNIVSKLLVNLWDLFGHFLKVRVLRENVVPLGRYSVWEG